MSAPQISVLMPYRNAASTLPCAVESVLNQTFAAFELLAINDGSTDGGDRWIHALSRIDARVRPLVADHRGLVPALNFGLQQSRAPYVARMDADDECLPARLEKSLAALESDPTLAAVGTQIEIFCDDRPVSPNLQAYAAWLNHFTSPGELAADQFVESPLCHPSTTLRRAALEEVGGWEEGDFPEDYHLWLKLLERGHRLKAVAPVLFRWRDHQQRLTRTHSRYRPEAFLSLKADFLARRLGAGAAAWLWGLGAVGKRLRRLLSARGVRFTRYIEVDPGKVGQRIDGAPVVSPQALGSPGAVHLIAAVGAKGARAEIRAFLTQRGWQEGRDFTCAA